MYFITYQGIIGLSVFPLAWGAAGDIIDYLGYDSSHEVDEEMIPSI